MSARTLRTLFTSILLTLVAAPIAMLPYGGDDVANRNWAGLSWSASIRQAYDLNVEWTHSTGRFFPGGVIYELPLWHVLDSRVAYTTYLVLLNLALIGLVGFVAFKMTRSPIVAAFAAVVLGACMQIRMGTLDGLSSFGGLVLYTLVLTILSALGAAVILRTGNRWLVIPTAVGWALAITAYEVSLFMLPAMLVLILVTSGRRDRRTTTWALAPLVVPAFLQVAITLYLRSQPTTPGPAYTVNLDGPVGQTFMKQFTAALPSSQYFLGGTPDGVGIHPGLALLLIVSLAVPAFLAWRPIVQGGVTVSWRIAVGLMVAGAWAWVVPSLLASVTQRWQSDLIWGQGYIYLAYEYAGVALLAGGAFCLLAGRDRPRSMRGIGVTVFALALLACAITVSSNLVFAGQFVPGPAGPG